MECVKAEKSFRKSIFKVKCFQVYMAW